MLGASGQVTGQIHKEVRTERTQELRVEKNKEYIRGQQQLYFKRGFIATGKQIISSWIDECNIQPRNVESIKSLRNFICSSVYADGVTNHRS